MSIYIAHRRKKRIYVTPLLVNLHWLRVPERIQYNPCILAHRVHSSAERSRRCESTSDSGWINSDRYCGAAAFRQRGTRMQGLYWMRSGTCSQCRFTSSGVTWSNLRASAVSRAAAFSTDWIRSRSRCGNPSRALLQLSILDVMDDVTNIDSASRGSELQMQHIWITILHHSLLPQIQTSKTD